MAFNFVAMASFDNYATSDLSRFFNLSQQGVIDSSNTPFGVGKSVSFANVASWRTLATPTTKLGVICYFKTTNLTATPFFIRLYDNITAQTTVIVDGSGFVKIIRGDTNGTVLATSVSAPVLVNSWYHIEAKFTCTTNSSANDCQVWVNGVLVVSLAGSLSTRNTSNTQYTSVWVGNVSTTTYVDDFVIYDWSIGDAPPIGQCRIQSLTPNGNGASNDFVGSDGNSVNNYLLTNEVPVNTANYVGSATNGNIDLYTMTDLITTPSTIFAVQVSSIGAKTNSGSIPGRNIIRLGSTNYSGSDQVISPTYQQNLDVFQVDPSTGLTWVYTAINSMQAGVTVQAITFDTGSAGTLVGSTGIVTNLVNNVGSAGVLIAGAAITGGLLPTGYTGWWSAGVQQYKDAGVTLATNGDHVWQWNNQAPSATIHMANTSNSNTPTLVTSSLNGYPGLQFNGTSHFLTVASSFGSGDWPCTLCIVGKWNNTQTDGNPRIFGYGQNQSFYRNGSHNWGAYAVPSTQDLGQSADSNSVAILRCDATGARQFRFNGAAPGGTLQFSGVPSGTRLALGCHGSDGGELASCIIYEVIHYPYLLNDTDAASVESFLNAKFAIY